MDCRHLQTRPRFGQLPHADIRQLRDLVRYHWKLTNFTTGEKNRAQNCLTVSNIKLDDVFADVFGKAAPLSQLACWKTVSLSM